MRKITITTVALFCFITLFGTCFAAENSAVIEKIANQMIKDNELNVACIKKERLRASETITIDSIKLSKTNNTFLVSSKSGPCYMGNSTTALWIYKKNDGNDNYLKIFGAEYPNDIKPNGNLFNKGLLDIDAIYNAGNFDPGVIETYRFNGKKYKLFKKRANQ